MTLKQYVPLSIGIFVLTVIAVHSIAFPVMPFAVILLFGETLVGFQVEDQRVPRFVASIFGKAGQVDPSHPERAGARR